MNTSVIIIMRVFYVLFAFNFLLLIVLFPGEANNNIETSKRVYIVYMGATTLSNGVQRRDHSNLLIELKKRNEGCVVQTYNKGFLGFAARLSHEESKSLAERSGVVSVFPNRISQLHTTRSWDFLSSQNSFINIDSTPTSSRSTGADTIIGILDTGIWPESPSFDDKHMGPIPSRWNGTCMPGLNLTSFTCNRKVIGAMYYPDPESPGSVVTPRDEDGHGTHIASTIAGGPISGASYYGLAKGLARGGLPSSRLAVYRVCGELGCYDSSILKAFDDAIGDGVDVISISIGGEHTLDFVNDPIPIGAFHAVEKGITVVASTGNEGPSPRTVRNVAPWILTVGATTIDRDFEADILLGPNQVIKGGGINFSGLNKSAVYPLVDGHSASNRQSDVADARNCVPGSLDDDKVNGTIVLCESKDEDYEPIEKLNNLKKQGAIGMILIDNYQRQVAFMYGGIFPIATVSEEGGAQIRSYINSTSNALVTILPTRTIPNYKPAPSVAYFSSRGPAIGILNLIKPDVVAPGVDIVAAWPPFNDSSWVFPNKKPPLFNILSGTSMSCPHVSALAATIKSLHHTWTPSAIKSAIMTTAIQTNNLHAPITTNTGMKATPYDIGAGEINVLRSLCPGLVYETGVIDYSYFLCNMGYNASVIKTMVSKTIPNNFSCSSNSSFDLISDMNYPSIAISNLKAEESRTVKRTVTNVGGEYSTYTATVDAPDGIQVQVMPNKLSFTNKVKKLTFQVKFTLTTSSKEEMFGSITWSNVNNKVRSPFVVTKDMDKI